MVKPSLKVNLAGISMENPLMNASGILGLTAFSLVRLAEAGCGAVVTKSVGLKPREGNPNPVVVEVAGGLLNSMGLPNPGVEAFKTELKKALKRVRKPVLASIFGFKPEEYGELARRLDRLPLAGFELNLSCPHVEGLRELGSNPKLIRETVRRVKAATSKPVFAKLTPNVSSFVEVAEAAWKGGADGLTAVNTLRGLAIDVEAGKPFLSGVYGGLSGPALKPVALRCVYEAFETVKIPIIGCGGIFSWRDAVEFLLAGASALQVGTAIAYRGLQVFREILEGLKGYLASKGFRSLRELVGQAHRR